MNRRIFIKTTGLVAGVSAISPSLGAETFVQNTKDGIIPAEVIKAIRARIKPVTAEERLLRIEHARKLMGENPEGTGKLDALLMEGGTSLNYFSGARWGRSERLFAMILPMKGEPFFIAPKFEESRAKEQTGNAQVYCWEENENPYELIAKVFKEKNFLNGTLGIEETTRYFVTENIQKIIPTLKIKSGTVVTAGCRGVKTAHEIELMQIANDIAAEVYKAAVKQLKEGMSENEFGNIISNLFNEFETPGGALVLFGEASAHPHGLVKEMRLKQNDIVLMDGGCEVEGYESDITRMAVFGTATDKMKKNFDIVRKAQDEGLKAAKPGVEACTVDAAARKIITDNGYGPGYKYFTHRLGHGIGMDGHEWYYLVGGNKYILNPGNMFSNEPGIYIPGEFGIRLEDEMLITETGAKLLLPQQSGLEKMF
ncbi:MAG TPA: Xaa-Pro peptidase family protein [Bacteroidia bacterium]|jgi:Xaa-Pro dipeptidase|nr:Xaa-Pro peptidase family protein [Bacteroidia bacterium]